MAIKITNSLIRTLGVGYNILIFGLLEGQKQNFQPYAMEVMNIKTAHSHLPIHQNISVYVSQHFNPKLLPNLLNYLLGDPSLANTQQRQCMESKNSLNGKSNGKLVLNDPNLSLLLANLRVYDSHSISRENSIIETVEKWSDRFTRQNTAIPKQSGPQKHLIRLKTQAQPKSGCKISKKERCKSNKKQNLPSLFEFMDHCYRAFIIYEYRLKDLTALIKIISNHRWKDNSQAHHFQQIKNILEYLCIELLSKIQRSKQYIEECIQIYLQNAQNLAYNQLQQIFFPGQFKEDLPKLLFKIASYAKQYQLKMKEIHIKYTMISRQIMSRQGHRQGKKKEEQQNLDCGDMNREQMKQIAKNISSQNQSNNTFQSSHHPTTTIKNAFSNRSILKNKFGYKSKRISIQIITSLIETERNKKNKLFNEEKDSRFKHRLALNIGSLQHVNNQWIKGTRKMKKQVKIQQMPRQQNKDEKITDNSIQSKNRIEAFKSRQTNLLKYNQLCEKLQKEEEDQDKISQCSIFGKKKYGSLYSQQLFQSGTSRCTITSQASRKTKGKKNRSKSFNKRKVKSSTSCKDLNKRRSIKNKRQKTINQSLKIIFDEARDKKNANKLPARSGRRIAENFMRPNQGQLDSIRENIEDLKRNYKLRMNYKPHKNKYRLILQNFNKSKDSSSYEENLDMTTKKMSLKASKRMEENLPNQSQRILAQKRSSQIRIIDKNISLAGSVTSSRKYEIGNTRINNQEAAAQLKQKSMKKIKTQEDALNLVPAPAQFKVNFTDRLNIVDDFVKFYPNVQCTLHQIAKKRDRLEFLSHAQSEAQNRLLEFVPMANYHIKKHIHQQSLQGQAKERQLQKKIFQQQNLKLNFSKKIVTAANQLNQRQLCSYGNEHEIYS